MASDPVFRVAKRGEHLLTSPRFNKGTLHRPSRVIAAESEEGEIGTAFSADERRAFGLLGRLPHRINTLEEQCERAWDQLAGQESDLAKNTFLQSLRDQNWVLYYSLISRHLKELIPIIYTPTEVRLVVSVVGGRIC